MAVVMAADDGGRAALVNRRPAWRLVGRRIALAVSLLFLACFAPAVTAVPMPASAHAGFDARLRALSVNPTIRRAARHRLFLASRDPGALAIALQGDETPESVRSVLAGDVDEVVIVAWLVSFGAMGAWTAYDPRTAETVDIPASGIPALAAGPSGELGVYRLRDRQHLMLVQPVIDGEQAVGAVGFVLARAYADPSLAARAVQLGG